MEIIKEIDIYLNRHGLEIISIHDVNSELFANLSSNLSIALLIGNKGKSLEYLFENNNLNYNLKNPLDIWTTSVLDNVSKITKSKVIYPFSGPPFFNFFDLAIKSDLVNKSPIGLLIHRDYGLWFSYRGIILLNKEHHGYCGNSSYENKEKSKSDRSEDRENSAKYMSKYRDCRKGNSQHKTRKKSNYNKYNRNSKNKNTQFISPCLECEARPCLTSCPVNAFSENSYDVIKCVKYLKSKPEKSCINNGCKARLSCHYQNSMRYGNLQIRHHMKYFINGDLFKEYID